MAITRPYSRRNWPAFNRLDRDPARGKSSALASGDAGYAGRTLRFNQELYRPTDTLPGVTPVPSSYVPTQTTRYAGGGVSGDANAIARRYSGTGAAFATNTQNIANQRQAGYGVTPPAQTTGGYTGDTGAYGPPAPPPAPPQTAQVPPPPPPPARMPEAAPAENASQRWAKPRRNGWRKVGPSALSTRRTWPVGCGQPLTPARRTIIHPPRPRFGAGLDGVRITSSRTDMARPLSYERADAGAATLNQIQGDLDNDRRFRYTVARQDAQDARQAERDAKTDLRYEAQDKRQAGLDEVALDREKRLAEGANLDNEMQRYRFEKEKTLDDNAKIMRIELDREAKEGANELFKINTDAPDADVKLAEWGAKYFRALDPDPKLGDPRLIRQFQINQGRVERAQAAKQAAAEKRAKFEADRLDEAQKLRGTETIKDGERTITRPIPPPGSPEDAQRQKESLLKQHDTLLSGITAKSGKSDPAPEEITSINSVRKQLGFELLDAKGKAIPNTAAPVVAPLTATNPKTGQKLVFKDGQWQPL